MADERLRALTRAAQGGDPQAEARLLRERLRQEDVDPEHVQLLAYLEHEPAVLALEGSAPHSPEGAESWVRGLEPWGKRCWVQAAVGAARLVLPMLEAFGPPQEGADPQEGVEAAEAWLRDPGPETERAASLAGVGLLAEFLANNVQAEDAGYLSPARVVHLAESFRTWRAAAYAAGCAGSGTEDVGQSPSTMAVMAAVAARERLALAETPTTPGVLSPLHLRAAQADRLGELPELNTLTANAKVRDAMRVAVLTPALENLP